MKQCHLLLNLVHNEGIHIEIENCKTTTNNDKNPTELESNNARSMHCDTMSIWTGLKRTKGFKFKINITEKNTLTVRIALTFIIIYIFRSMEEYVYK